MQFFLQEKERISYKSTIFAAQKPSFKHFLMKTKIFLLSLLFVSSGLFAQESDAPFEGEIHYTNTVAVDKTISKLFGGAKSGEYTMKVVVKDGKEYGEESYSGMYTISLPAKNEVYIFSKLTKEGYKYPFSYYAENAKKIKDLMEGNIASTGEKKEIHGFPCERYKGAEKSTQDIFGVKMVTTRIVDYWVCKQFPKEWIGSLEVPGKPFDYEDQQTITLPIVGDGVQAQTVHVSKVVPRAVEEKEFEVPADVTFTEMEDGYSAMRKLQKDIRKYMKKNKLTDNGVRTEGVGDTKNEEWDF